MKVVVLDTEEEVDAYGAQMVLSLLKQKPQAVIGYATGETPLGMYGRLIAAYRQGQVSFHDSYAFNLDEYVGLDSTHPQSFAYAMQEALFSHIDILPDHIYHLDGGAKDIDQALQSYEQQLALHPIDLQILGLGMDGHIAYNEPGSPLDGPCHIVDLHPASIQSSLAYGFERIEDVPKQGMTMGIGTIMKAKQWLMMVKGAKKAGLVKRMLSGEVSSDFPASVIVRHANAWVVLDRAAAKEWEG